MKCINCNADILPQYKAAINRNECPGCGDKIYNDETYSLIGELSSALEKMPNDPEGLTFWLLSNYKVTKIGSAEPVKEFYGKKPKSQTVDESNLKVAKSPVQDFMKRTGVKPKTPEELAEVYKKIADARDGDEVEPIQEEYSDDDPEVQAIAATMNKPITKKQMQQFKQHQVSSEFDHVDDRHPAIQQERMERLRKQNELADIGAVGKINRRS